MLSGKILQPADWLRLFQAILDAPIVEEGVLTVVSDEVSGSIGVKQGRWLMGASTSTGLKGASAVRQLISLPQAQFGYLDAQKVKVRASINQQLQVDIGALLSDPSTPIVDNPSAAPAQQQQLPPAIPAPRPLHEPVAAAASKPQTPAEIATAELRKTFNQLRPVPNYYQAQVPPPPPGPGGNLPKPGQSGIRHAISAPPKVVSPPVKPAQKPSSSYNPWGGDDDSPEESAPEQAALQAHPQAAQPMQTPQAPQSPQPPQPPPPPPEPPRQAPPQQAPAAHAGQNDFEFDPNKLPEQPSGTGRKRVNPLDKLIYGAASTCMKLTSLKQREKERQEAAAREQQAENQNGWAQNNPWGSEEGAQSQKLGQPWGTFAQAVPGQTQAPPAPPSQPAQNQPGFAPPLGPNGAQPQNQPPSPGMNSSSHHRAINPDGTPQQPPSQGMNSSSYRGVNPDGRPQQPPSQGMNSSSYRGVNPDGSPQQPPQGMNNSSSSYRAINPDGPPQQPQGMNNSSSSHRAINPDGSPQRPPQGMNNSSSSHRAINPDGSPQIPSQGMNSSSYRGVNPNQTPSQGNFAPQNRNEHYPTSPASPAPNANEGYVHPNEQTKRSQPYEPRNREPVPGQPGPPPRPVADPIPPQPHPHVAVVMPHMVAPPLDPAEARNMVDAVRATAWRIASRVAYEAKMRMENDNGRQSDNQRLRTIEHTTASITENAKQRRKLWPPDITTIAFAVCVLLGLGVIVGGILLVTQQQGNKPYVSTGKRYLSEGKDELAIAQFTLATEKDPHDADAVQFRAEIYEKLKDWEHASADYSRLWELKPKHYDAARKAAFFQFKLRNYENGEKIARKLLAAKPDDASARAQIVMNLSRNGKYDEAIIESAQVDNDLVPPYLVPDFFSALGFAYQKTNELKQAVRVYSKALEADPQNENSLVERAGTYMALKDYKKAAEDYRVLTKLFPARAGGYADYAKAAMLSGDAKTAAAQYAEAIKLSPSVLYYIALAQADMAIGNYGHAVYDCDCALKLQPTAFEAAHIRTEALQKAKSGKAIVTAKITPFYITPEMSTGPVQRVAAPNVPIPGQDPLTQQGYRLLLAKNWAGAAQVLSGAIKRSPRDWSARRFYAAANMEMGRYADAMQAFDVMAANRAILASDEMPYAECAAKAGKAERALELYNGCLNRDPTFLEARLAMIKLCVQKGFTAKAQALVKEGATMQPATRETLEKALAGSG